MNPSSSMNEQGSTVTASSAEDDRTNASEASFSNNTSLSSNTNNTSTTSLATASTLSNATNLPGNAALSAPLRFAGFWAAVALPFLHIPLLITGLDSNAKLAAYVALLSLNVIALVVGHSYSPE